MDEDTVKKYGEVWLEDYEAGLKNIPDMEKAHRAYLEYEMTDKAHPFENKTLDMLMYGVDGETLMKRAKMFESAETVSPAAYIGPWHEQRPAGLYHHMLRTICPYSIKGVIWYQGESDEKHPEIYADMMEGLIRCWRSDWNDPFPFLMTQLAPFGEVVGNGGREYPKIREQQDKVTNRLKDVFCASIGDVGDLYDIHPKEKKPVGERLALLARGHVYHENLLCDAPVLCEGKLELISIILAYEFADGGLQLEGN